YFHSENNPGSISANSIHYIYKDSRGTLWIGSRAGLSRFDRSRDSFINYKITEIPNDGDHGVNSILADKNGTLWIGTPKVLYTFNTITEKFTDINIPQLDNTYIFSICEGRDNTLWLGSTRGLFRFNPRSNETEVYHHESGNLSSISGNVILNLLQDKSGILWINSYGAGINKLNSNESRFKSYSYYPGDSKSLSDNSVTAFCMDSNSNIWIGTSNGLNKFDEVTGTFESFHTDELFSDRITSLAADRNLLWVGTAKGIKLFDTVTGKYKQIPASLKQINVLNNLKISSLMKDNRGYIFIGTYGNGFYVYSPETDSIKHYTSGEFQSNNIRTDYVLTIYQDELDTDICWIGTYGGLIRMKLNNNSFTIFSHSLSDFNSISYDYIFSIIRDTQKNLWIGTANGLNRYDDATKRFVHFFEKDGLPNSVICSLNDDGNGNIWISTNYGISRYSISKNEFTNYNQQDGLRNNMHFNKSSFMDKEGNIFFGGTNGFDIIQPALFRAEDYTAPVFITSLEKVNSKGGRTEVITGEEINLNYDENFIGINFISLDYNNPLKNLYRYKLEGIDDDWVNAGNNNQASYTDLAPGKYIFRVKGSNSNGIFSPAEATLYITILPPFWKTTWFSTLILLTLAVSAYLLFRMRVKYKIKYALEIERIKEEESEILRRKTAADFHDELGHRLTRISLLSEIIKRKIGNTSSEITDLLNKISTNSIELYEGTKDFIWAIDPNKDSLYELLIRLKDFGDELFEDSNILFEVNGLDESLRNKPLTMDWKRHLALIFKEGMNNSLKHGEIKKISINTKIDIDDVELTLSDDGRGFSPDLAIAGNGLRNMKRRAEKLSGKLEIKSSPGTGTQIYFKGKLPGKAIYYN
ncbi:MAG TPA: two-component regulator propeller domain-containing protein, partial [Ignavibacteriaceae bacterium]